MLVLDKHKPVVNFITITGNTQNHSYSDLNFTFKKNNKPSRIRKKALLFSVISSDV